MLKIAYKMKIIFKNSRKEANFEQDFVAGSAHV